LKQLTFLYLQYNQINDLSPLAELKQLTFLYLQYNQINDLSPIKNLKLRVLKIENNLVEE
ncbi:MAG: leucine-rich repeat domain-containing protein, partial [Bacteroidota bacterium]